MSFVQGDIIQANEDFSAFLTVPNEVASRIVEIKAGNIYKVSGLDNHSKEYYLIEDSGPGAEVNFKHESKFTKIN